MHRNIAIIALILTFCTCLPCIAQLPAPSVNLSAVYGGNLDDAGSALLLGELGEIFIGGWSRSVDGQLMNNEGGRDYWIAKLDSDGSVLWSNNYGGNNNDELRAMSFTAQDNIVAFGKTFSSGGIVGTNPGLPGAWLLNLDQAGNVRWSKVYAGQDGEEGVDIVAMADGGFVLLVQASSPELEGELSNGMTDIWVAKVNPIGDIQWSTFIGGPGNDVPTRIQRTFGGFLICGYTDLAGGDVTETNGGADFWLVKIDDDGDLVWEQTYGGTGEDVAHDLCERQDGDIYVLGTSNSGDGDKTDSLGSSDVWLLRTNLNGDLIWEESFGGSNIDLGRRLAFDEDAQVLTVGGGSFSDDGHLTGNRGREDLWIFHTDANGMLLSQLNYGGSEDEVLGGIALTGNDLYVCSTAESDDFNIPSPDFERDDLWLMRLRNDTIPCSSNDRCALFVAGPGELSPVSNGPITSVNGCNVGFPTGPDFNLFSCPDVDGPAAWYKINTDSAAEIMNMAILTEDFNEPRITLVQTNNCFTFEVIICVTGDEEGALLNVEVEPDATYYAIISDAGGYSGDFNLFMNVIDVNFCNIENALYATQTSMGSALEGPYLPGESVTFCYELTQWDKLECNALQGIVPTFGEGWDENSFNFFGQPLQIDTMLVPFANGSWNWYPLGVVRYNFTNQNQGYQGGQSLPAGWYFLNADDPPPNNDPNETVGDLTTCLEEPQTWKVCFTLQTQSSCTTNLDCSVTMKTFADGETGRNVNLSCLNDLPTEFTAFMSCCVEPRIDPIGNFTICSGDTLAILLESNLPSPVLYNWQAESDGSVDGAMDGQGQAIIQTLTNTSDSVAIVNYTVNGSGPFCDAPTEVFQVSVRPIPAATLALVGPDTICPGEETLIRFELIGTSPYFIGYSINGVLQPIVVVEEPFATVPVTATVDATIRMESFEDSHCVGSALGFAEIKVRSAASEDLELSICEGDTVLVAGQAIVFPGTYQILLPGGAANGCDSTIQLDLSVNRTYDRDVQMTICEGEGVVIGNSFYTEPGNYVDSLISSQGCDSIINLSLAVEEDIVTMTNQTICFGNTVTFGGQIISESGTYTDTFQINAVCDSISILNLNVIDRIALIETVIGPDNGAGDGSIEITVQGGLGDLAYAWSTGDTSEDLTDLISGTYQLTVTDQIGCSAEFEFFVPLGTATEDLDPFIVGLKLYPNPTRLDVDIILAFQYANQRSMVARFDLLALDGRTLISRRMGIQPGENRLNLINPGEPGMYLMVMTTPDGTVTRKVIVL